MNFKLSFSLCIFFLFTISVFAQKNSKDTTITFFDECMPFLKSYPFVYGDLKYSNNDKEYKQDFSFNPMSFDSTSVANFYRAIFDGSAFFGGINFHCRAVFNSAHFYKDASFPGAKFNYEVVFKDAHFYGEAAFMGANFHDQVVFYDTHFYKVANFRRAKFNYEANFRDSTFNYYADFRGATFNHTNFSFAKFNQTANFRDATFIGGCDFFYSRFKNVLDLTKLKNTDTATLNFYNARLPHLIDLLGNPNLKIDFTEANFDSTLLYTTAHGWHYINLHNANLTKIKFDYQHFKACFFSGTPVGSDFPFNFKYNSDSYLLTYKKDGKKIAINSKYGLDTIANNDAAVKILLNDEDVQHYLKQIFPSAKLSDPVITIFLNYCIDELEFPKALSADEEQAAYEQILKNFKDNGQNDSYEALDIEYRDFKNGSFILPHIWNLYGYRREWVFYWALAFLVLFTISTTFLIGKLNKPTDQGGVYHMENLSIDPATERWYNRLWYAFMYTSTLFFVLKVDVGKLNFKKKWGVFYIILIYSFGVLCLGYMANFVLQK